MIRAFTRRWLAAGFAIAACLIVVVPGAFAAPRYTNTLTPIAVTATRIAAYDNRDPTRVRFGALEFRGGLVLTASYEAFGGISALHVEPDGSHFVAVTDNGSWLRGRIVYDKGRPAGIADAEMAALLGSDGRSLAAHGWFDSESLAESDGALYVGIERVEKIVRFDYAHHGLSARGEPIDVPADFKTFTYNKSLECLAVPPKGAALAGQLIAVTERSLDAAGNHRSFLFDAGRVARFTVKHSDDFDVSDCTVLPPGDLLLLERRFSLARGVAIRIRRIALAGIAPGALVDGTPLIEADLAYQIDNMEGIAVHRNVAGETIITLVSDDNFSVLQRTLLLQFAIVGE
jgi:hypothetical protein